MAYIEEDHISCSSCGCITFKTVEVLKIDKRVGKTVKRDIKSLPLPEHLLEKEIKYECTRCGTTLDV